MINLFDPSLFPLIFVVSVLVGFCVGAIRSLIRR